LVLAIFLIGIAMSLPWWIRSNSTGQTQTWYLTSGCNDGRCVSYQGFAPLQSMFGLTNTLVVAGLAFSLATLATYVVSLFRPSVAAALIAEGIFGALAMMAAPVYLFFALPGTVSLYSPFDVVGSFFGSCSPPGSGCTSAESWGGGGGWFISIAAIVVFLSATTIALFVLTLESTPAGQAREKSHDEGCLRPLGEYYRAFVVMEDRVTKWPAPRDEVESDVLRVSVNGHTN